MPNTLAALNLQTALVDQHGHSTKYFATLWLALMNRTEAAPFAAAGQVVSVSAQVAAIALTALVASASSPVYEISYDVRIAVAGGVSSAVQVTFSWTQGGITQTRVGANVNGNLTTSKDSDVFLIRPDAGTTINYSVSYASAGLPDAQFEADFVAKSIG